MFGSQVFQVMIGLVLIYLALGVACSGTKEVSERVFAVRSKTLEAAFRKIVARDPVAEPKNHQHPEVK